MFARLLAEHADVRRRGLQVLVKQLRSRLPAKADHRAYDLLRRALDDAGFADVDLTVALVIGGALDLPGTRD